MQQLLGIRKITILATENHTDKVSIHTTLPSSFPVGVGNDYLIMDFDVQKGKGIQYVKNNFNNCYIIEHINGDTGEHKIIS